MWNRLLTALAILLLMAGCEPEEALICGQAPAWEFEEAGGACPAGPTDCVAGLGCRDEVCASCQDNDECRDGLACRGGRCGACALAEDCRDGQACSQGFCVDPVPTWDLAIDPGDFEALHDQPFHDFYYPCVLTADGVDYADGCRIRSYGSTARTFPKKSFRITFPEDFEHPGYSRKITLRSEYNDRTMLRNHLGYETFRHLLRVPAPRTRFVNLRVNGEVYGLFVELERPGGKWLKRNARDRDRSMYEAEHSPDQGGLMPMLNLSMYDLMDDDVMYNKKAGPEGPGEPDDFADLAALIEETLWADLVDSPGRRETTLERTAEALDVNTLASYLAVMALLQNRDHVTANYNISWQHDSLGQPRWEIYPYDLDTTFGCVYNPGAGNNYCDNLQTDLWWLNGLAPEDGAIGSTEPAYMNLAYHLTLAEPGCALRFEERLCDYLDGPFWSEELPRLVLANAATIRPSVLEDPNDRNLDADGDEFDEAVDELVRFIPARADYLRMSLGCE